MTMTRKNNPHVKPSPAPSQAQAQAQGGDPDDVLNNIIIPAIVAIPSFSPSSSSQFTPPTPSTSSVLDYSHTLVIRPLHPTSATQKKKKKKASNAKANRKRDIVREFDDYFGSASKLENWQMLCEDLGLEGDFGSLTKCRKALKSVYVNIYDLLDAVKLKSTDDNAPPPKHFPSLNALIRYTKSTGRIYPKKKAKGEGPVRELLRHIFGHRQ